MTDIQERLEHYEAKDRERQELADAIKECDLDLFNITWDKTEPDAEFRATYLQRGIMLRQYRQKYGQKAEEQLRDQLDEARRALAEQYEAKKQIESQNGQINELRQQLSEIDAVTNAHACEIIDVKRRILDELYKFPAVDLLGVLLELQQREARKKGVKNENQSQ